MERTYLNPPDLPTPIGPFSYGVLDDDTIYVSGAVGTDENWNTVGKGDVAAQTQRAFENIEKVLKAAGCSLRDVIKMTMYLVKAADYKPMNEVRKRMFQPPYPGGIAARDASAALWTTLLYLLADCGRADPTVRRVLRVEGRSPGIRRGRRQGGRGSGSSGHNDSVRTNRYNFLGHSRSQGRSYT